MAHIHSGRGQHDLTASAYIIKISGTKPLVLLHTHKLLGKYLQIGGHVELDETPWQAISHELREEAGYNLSQVKVLQPKKRIRQLTGTNLHPMPVCLNTHNFSPEHFHTDIAFAFVTSEEPANDIKDGESKDIGWYSESQLDAMSEDQVITNIKEVYKYILNNYLRDWEAVPTNKYKL